MDSFYVLVICVCFSYIHIYPSYVYYLDVLVICATYVYLLYVVVVCTNCMPKFYVLVV